MNWDGEKKKKYLACIPGLGCTDANGSRSATYIQHIHVFSEVEVLYCRHGHRGAEVHALQRFDEGGRNEDRNIRYFVPVVPVIPVVVVSHISRYFQEISARGQRAAAQKGSIQGGEGIRPRT